MLDLQTQEALKLLERSHTLTYPAPRGWTDSPTSFEATATDLLLAGTDATVIWRLTLLRKGCMRPAVGLIPGATFDGCLNV